MNVCIGLLKYMRTATGKIEVKGVDHSFNSTSEPRSGGTMMIGIPNAWTIKSPTQSKDRIFIIPKNLIAVNSPLTTHHSLNDNVLEHCLPVKHSYNAVTVS